MILTIAAWKENLINFAKSGFQVQAIHLDEQFPILLNVLVGELHLLPLLSLHGNVDVHLEKKSNFLFIIHLERGVKIFYQF